MTPVTVWRHAFRMARAHPGPFLLAFTLYISVFGLLLTPGLIVRAVFNTLSGHASAGLNAWTLIGLLVASGVSRMGLLYICGWQLNVFRLRAEATLRVNIMRWLAVSPGVRTLPGSPGEAVSRFRDDVGELVGFGLAMLTSPQLMVAFAALSIMLSINVVVTLGVAAPLLVVVAVTYALSRRLRAYRRASREAGARVASFLGETFGAVLAIRLAAAEPRVIARLDDLNQARRAAAIRDLVFSSSLTAVNANVIALGTGLVLMLAASAMRAGTFTVGDFMLFAAYLGPAAGIPLYIGQVIAMEKQSAVSVERMGELMGGAPPTALTDRPSTPAADARVSVPRLESFSVRGLTCRHPASGRGVEGVDIALSRGSFTVIAGRVASGKTTLIRALLGLLPLDAGELAWNGEAIADPSSFMVPPRCAYTAQAPRLFSETLGENIAMGLAPSPADLAAAIELAVFEEDLAGFDTGLATVVGTRGVTLSGGQVQRVAAARMFLRAPDLLVFDDVSSALDIRTEQRLWRGLFAAGSERTCLAVSHRHAAFRRADQIIVLDAGRVAAKGDLATLRRDSALFREIWRDG